MLSPHIANLFTEESSAAFLPKMLRTYIETLLKPSKDQTTPSNFRLKSLLKLDIKLYAKIIAHRLTHITPTLVQPDQKGFTSGRQS